MTTTLSTNSVHRFLQNATHASLTEDKTNALISSRAVLDVMAALRTGPPRTR